MRRPRIRNHESVQSATGVAQDFSPPGWLTTWKVHAALLAFWTVSLVGGPLQSSVPLVGIYFPGAFMAMGVWAIVKDLAGWTPTRRAVASILPVSLYLVAATVTLFVAFEITDRDPYRQAGFGSLFMTVPFGAGGIALALVRHRLPGGRDFGTRDQRAH